MRFSRSLCIFLMCLLFVNACSRILTEDPDQSKKTPTTNVEVTSVSLHRSECLGECPIYTVSAKADGIVTYNGEQHVKVTGNSVGSISAEDFAYLVKSIDQLGFWSWNEQYVIEKDGCGSVWTDNSTIDIIVVSNSGEKRVTYYYGCREFVLAPKIHLLSLIIDDITDSQKWVGLEE